METPKSTKTLQQPKTTVCYVWHLCCESWPLQFKIQNQKRIALAWWHTEVTCGNTWRHKKQILFQLPQDFWPCHHSLMNQTVHSHQEPLFLSKPLCPPHRKSKLRFSLLLLLMGSPRGSETQGWGRARVRKADPGGRRGLGKWVKIKQHRWLSRALVRCLGTSLPPRWTPHPDTYPTSSRRREITI